MKQCIDRACGNQGGPQPSSGAMPQAESLSSLRAFRNHADSLHQKIGRRQAVACAGGNRDHQVMEQTRSSKRAERCYHGTEAIAQWLEHPGVRKFAKAKVPAFAPQFAKRAGL